MPKFEDLISLMATANEENPLPGDFAEQLINAHNEDLSIRDQAVDTHVAQLAERDNAIKELKAHNYELLRKIPVDTKPTGAPNNAEDDEPTEYTGTIDDLFKKKG